MIVKNLTSKVLKSIFFLAIFSLWTVVLMAQCNLTGTVVPAGKGGCDVWIKLEDETLLQPVNRLDKLRESQEIEFFIFFECSNHSLYWCYGGKYQLS
ncbi:MAG: hypothetical protein IPL95_01130 [Saprospiraceae bacterium]|nr:hypothetical protein [Saprospiraceae bacterium]